MGWEVSAVALAASLVVPGLAQGQAVAPQASSASLVKIAVPTASSPVVPVATPIAASTPLVASRHVLAAGSFVPIELAEQVSSKTHKRGDMFAITLAAPIVLDGQIVVPIGTKGVGEVIDAGSGGMGGRPGKLILATRYIDYEGQRIPLRAFRLAAAGVDHGGAALAIGFVPYAGILGLAVTGGDVTYPAGMEADAKVTADVLFPAMATSPPPGSPTSATLTIPQTSSISQGSKP